MRFFRLGADQRNAPALFQWKDPVLVFQQYDGFLRSTPCKRMMRLPAVLNSPGILHPLNGCIYFQHDIEKLVHSLINKFFRYPSFIDRLQQFLRGLASGRRHFQIAARTDAVDKIIAGAPV